MARPTLLNKSPDWKNFKIDFNNKFKLNFNLKTTVLLEGEMENFNKGIKIVACDYIK